ncbi:MAG: hypothetical protein QOG62_674 [Thermoleophilaceae bacterium]|nr:hypothetical protein [Thermoleophilaceae bacterium]
MAGRKLDDPEPAEVVRLATSSPNSQLARLGSMAARPSQDPAASESADSHSTRVRLTAVERRERIVGAAREVFLEAGLAGARISEIGAVAGVNEALIYRHFESKEQLFEVAITEPLEATIAALHEQGPEADTSIWEDPVLRKEQAVAVIGTLLTGVLEIAPGLGTLLSTDPERGRAFYTSRVLPTIERLSADLLAVREHWGYGGVEARLVVASAVGTCLALAVDHQFGGTMLEDRDRVVRELTEQMMFGVNGPPPAT